MAAGGHNKLNDFVNNMYKIGVGEPLRRLSMTGIEDLCQIISQEPKGRRMWMSLAEELGLDNDTIARIKTMNSDNPALEVVAVWMERSGSTIYVLRNALGKILQRQDLVDRLDELCLDYVLLNIEVLMDGAAQRDDQLSEQLSTATPGSKPLIEHVRPIINQLMELNLRPRPLKLRLKDTTNGDWTSPARKFRGFNVTIVMETSTGRPRGSEPLSRPTHEMNQRNVISWMEQDYVFFERVTEPVPVAEHVAVIETTPSTSLSQALTLVSYQPSSLATSATLAVSESTRGETEA